MKTTAMKKALSAILAATLSLPMLSVTASADKWVTTTNGIKYQYTDGTYAKSKWLTTTTGKKYYIKSDGIRATGLLTINNTDGTKATYFFNSSGVMQTGWVKNGSKLMYFQKSGKAAKDTKIKIGDYAYKFDSNGYWNGIVYSADGKKDVTKSVDASALTKTNISVQSVTSSSSAATSTSSGTLGQVKTLDPNEKIPATITIKGIKYSTSEPLNPNTSGKNNYTKGYINIKGCTDKDLECLKYMQNLKSLVLKAFDETEYSYDYNYTSPSKITNLDFLYYLPNLEYFTIENAPYLTNIDGLSACKNLKSVTINSAPITNIDALSNATKLQSVTFMETYLDNLNGLKNAVNLKTVECSKNYLTDISALANKSKLTMVSLSQNRRLKDISALASCDKLETVYLSGCTAIEDWNVLKNCKSLEYVACYHTIIGSKGPEAFAKWFNANGGTAAYEGGIRYYGGSSVTTHQITKEILLDKAWDYSNRPSNVRGDDIKCTCDMCTKDSVSSWPKEFWLGYEKVK